MRLARYNTKLQIILCYNRITFTKIYAYLTQLSRKQITKKKKKSNREPFWKNFCFKVD